MQSLHNNEAEIEALYHRHGPALLLFALAIAGDRGRAQDALHQVFLRLLERADLRQIADVKSYLFASVRNAILNDFRIRQRNVVLDGDSVWFEPPQRDYAAELNLRRSLCALPEDQRQVIILHVWGGLTFMQIAEILEISSNTVASRYRYGLARLREAMWAKEDSSANASR